MRSALLADLYYYEAKFHSDNAYKFAGYASVFGNKDDLGDIVKRGAFKESIDW